MRWPRQGTANKNNVTFSWIPAHDRETGQKDRLTDRQTDRPVLEQIA